MVYKRTVFLLAVIGFFCSRVFRTLWRIFFYRQRLNLARAQLMLRLSLILQLRVAWR